MEPSAPAEDQEREDAQRLAEATAEDLLLMLEWGNFEVTPAVTRRVLQVLLAEVVSLRRREGSLATALVDWAEKSE